jgi:hypothetical protein
MKITGRKKGVLDIEFMLSVFVFLTALSFVLITLVSNIPKFHQDTVSQDIKAKAFQISEMLMFDQGWPTDWTGSTAKRIGLSEGSRYILNSSKIDNFVSLCINDYSRVKNMLGLEYNNDIVIEINTGGTTKICKPAAVSTSRSKATVTRLGVDSSTKNISVMTVSVL